MLLFKVWNKGKTIRKAVLTNSFVEFIVEPCSRVFDCGFCLSSRAFDYLFFQKSNSLGLSGGGGGADPDWI